MQRDSRDAFGAVQVLLGVPLVKQVLSQRPPLLSENPAALRVLRRAQGELRGSVDSCLGPAVDRERCDCGSFVSASAQCNSLSEVIA